jgi:dCMP deaminase
MRPTDFSWDSYFMNFAKVAASASYCERMKVGAVLVRNRKILATGFNGTLPGTDNCCEHTVDGHLVTLPDVVHAEQNILLFCNREGICTVDTTMYVTTAPCNTCALLMAGAGVTRVVYLNEYRDMSGVKRLQDHGVECEQLKG